MEQQRKDIDALTRELIDLSEQNLLGALLIAGSDGTRYYIDAVSKIVSVDDFMPNSHLNIHRRIFQAMQRAERTDHISTANTMHIMGLLQPGDIAYMSHLIANAVTSIDCELYAKQVKQLAEERRGNKQQDLRPKYKGGI